jgi:hypothetical protein
MNFDNYLNNPRDYAIELIENNRASDRDLLIACLKYMSKEEVGDMLDMSELSPRFIQDDAEIST